MMHRGRNWHWINEPWLDGEQIWQRTMGLPEGGIQCCSVWAKAAPRAEGRSGRRSTFHNCTYWLEYSGHGSLPLGGHSLGRLLQQYKQTFKYVQSGNISFLVQNQKGKCSDSKGERTGKIQHSHTRQENFGLAEFQLFHHSRSGRHFLH